MKKLVALLLAAAACAPTPEPKPKPVVTDRDKTFHALGLYLATLVEPFSLTPEELDLVADGLRAGVAGKGVVKMQDFEKNVHDLSLERLAARAGVRKQADAKLVAPLVSSPQARKLASGAVYVPVEEGTGRQPVKTDFVKVHYRATLADGTEFDSSRARGEPKVTPLDRSLVCWSDGIQQMRVGGKARIVCPSDTAYGDRGAFQQIPGGATLVYDLELLSIERQ